MIPGQTQRSRASKRPRHRRLPGSRQGWPLAAGLVAGVTLDALIGDPRRGHPVAAFGRAAAALESRVYADSRIRGAAYTAACVIAAAAPAAAAWRRTGSRPSLAWAAVTVTTWAVTGARTLNSEAERAAVALDSQDLAAARNVLPSLVGRDPSALDAKEIARAVVESVAENTSDAVVAPLLWGAVAGIPGLAGYRAVNTLDAMVGHRSARYENFGWASARLDDAANWIPARVTAALTVACAPLVGGSPAATLRAVRQYGARHPSPNAGRCEAAFAGALGVRLGGTNIYHGTPETRPELGDGRPPDPADIRRAIRLSHAVTLASTALAAAIALIPRPTLPVPRTPRLTPSPPHPNAQPTPSPALATPNHEISGFVRAARRGSSLMITNVLGLTKTLVPYTTRNFRDHEPPQETPPPSRAQIRKYADLSRGLECGLAETWCRNGAAVREAP